MLSRIEDSFERSLLVAAAATAAAPPPPPFPSRPFLSRSYTHLFRFWNRRLSLVRAALGRSPLSAHAVRSTLRCSFSLLNFARSSLSRAPTWRLSPSLSLLFRSRFSRLFGRSLSLMRAHSLSLPLSLGAVCFPPHGLRTTGAHFSPLQSTPSCRARRWRFRWFRVTVRRDRVSRCAATKISSRKRVSRSKRNCCRRQQHGESAAGATMSRQRVPRQVRYRPEQVKPLV